ncbi:hypothetical protein J11TS1_33730 [Oceanobacillus sp. J11TS1]|nr:hypothetical protein J11TS1_33730 [Oceanobacillus sp. J11TS1]
MFKSEKYSLIKRMEKENHFNIRELFKLLDFNYLINGSTAGEISLNEAIDFILNIDKATVELITVGTNQNTLVCHFSPRYRHCHCDCTDEYLKITYESELEILNSNGEYEINIPVCDCDYWEIESL